VLPVRYELNLYCYVEESRPPLWSSGQEFPATQRRCTVLHVRYELNLYCYVEESRPPLWSSGQEFLATQRRCSVFPV
jgi:hypothetical protein